MPPKKGAKPTAKPPIEPDPNYYGGELPTVAEAKAIVLGDVPDFQGLAGAGLIAKAYAEGGLIVPPVQYDNDTEERRARGAIRAKRAEEKGKTFKDDNG
jgi:hypothetical protein